MTSALYGFNLFMAGLAYFLLTQSLKGIHAPDTQLNRLTGSAFKEYLSTALYLVGIVVSLLDLVWMAYVIYSLVALIWVMPDRRYESMVEDEILSQLAEEEAG